MSYGQDGIRPVHTQYGVRNTGLTAGTDCDFDELTVELTAAAFQDGIFLPNVVIPKNTHFQRATLTVHEVFTLTGTTPTVQVGGTAPGTNGLTLTAAQLGAVGSIDVAADFTGTWSPTSTTGTTANEAVTIALGGTTPAVSGTVGKATLWIEYRYRDKNAG